MVNFPAPVRDPMVGQDGLITRPWIEYFNQVSGPGGLMASALSSASGVDSCFLWKSANQTITTATYTDITWSDEGHDTASFHSTTSNTDQLVIPAAGVYCFGAHAEWSSRAGGIRNLYITLNDPSPVSVAGILIRDIQEPNASSNTAYHTLATIRSLAANDVLRVAAYQTSGANVSIVGGVQYGGFWCFRVGDAS